MREQGTVIAARDGAVDVRLSPSDACASCGACAAADGASVLEGVPDSFGAGVGDIVEIEVPEQARTRARFVVLGLPILGLLGGYLAGFLLGEGIGISPDGLGAVTALTSVFVVMLWFPRMSARREADERYRVRVRAIIAHAATPSDEGVDSCHRPPDRGGPERE